MEYKVGHLVQLQFNIIPYFWHISKITKHWIYITTEKGNVSKHSENKIARYWEIVTEVFVKNSYDI